MSAEARRYWKVLVIALAILALELVGGWLSGSLALLSDAFHVFIDGLAMVTAIVVVVMVRKYPDHENVLRCIGAEIQGGSLIVISLGIVYEALKRFLAGDHAIVAPLMLAVAVVGCLGNWWQHRILANSHDHGNNLTHLGMAWHVLSDFWQSVAVIACSMIIWITGLVWIDLAVSAALAVVFFCWGMILLWKASRGEAPEEHH